MRVVVVSDFLFLLMGELNALARSGRWLLNAAHFFFFWLCGDAGGGSNKKKKGVRSG